jgi:hypothetical protein
MLVHNAIDIILYFQQQFNINYVWTLKYSIIEFNIKTPHLYVNPNIVHIIVVSIFFFINKGNLKKYEMYSSDLNH